MASLLSLGSLPEFLDTIRLSNIRADSEEVL